MNEAVRKKGMEMRPIPPPPGVLNIMKEELARITEWLVEKKGIAPTVTFRKGGLPDLTFPLPMENPPEAHAMVQGLIRTLQPEYVLICTDTWMKSMTPEEWERRNAGGYKRNLHEDPKSIEALNVLYASQKGIWMLVQPYHRDFQGTPKEAIVLDNPEDLDKAFQGVVESAFIGDAFHTVRTTMTQ